MENSAQNNEMVVQYKDQVSGSSSYLSTARQKSHSKLPLNSSSKVGRVAHSSKLPSKKRQDQRGVRSSIHGIEKKL